MKHYTYMIQGGFTFQFTFTESEIDVNDDGTFAPKPEAIVSLSDEIKVLLENNYASADVDLEEDYLVGLQDDKDANLIDWGNMNSNN